MNERDPGIPYYARHSVTDLTCPHCKGRVRFTSNESLWANYVCKCGKWTQYAVWGTEKREPKWEYVAEQAAPDVESDHA